MTEDDSMLKASPKGTQPTSLIPEIGPALARRAFSEVLDAINAPIERPFSCLPSSTCESARLSQLLEKKILRRIRQQKEVHKIDVELGDMMRLFRSNSGHTCCAVAYAVGLPFVRHYEIEQGQRSANLRELHAIFKFYGVDITEDIINAKTR